MKEQVVYMLTWTSYVAMCMTLLLSCAAAPTDAEDLVGTDNSDVIGISVDKIVIKEVIDFNFGSQSAQAEIDIALGETENTIIINNLYNTRNPPEEEQSGTFAFNLPPGYVTDLAAPMVVAFPDEAKSTEVTLGRFLVAEGSLYEPVNGNIKAYVVRARFAGISVDEIITAEVIDFNFGFQSVQAEINVEVGEPENTLTINNLYNILNPPENEQSGTFALNLPPGYVSDLAPPLTIEDPVGVYPIAVTLGRFLIAEGSLSEPVNGNIKAYVVRAEFKESLTPLLPGDIMATFSVGIEPNIMTEQGIVALNGATITISGLTNAFNDLADFPASGEIRITARPDYFTVDSEVIAFEDPPGYADVTITLPQTLWVTNTMTMEATGYAIEVVFAEKDYVQIVSDNIAAMYAYKAGGTTLIVEEGAIEIVGTRIVITGFMSPADAYTVEEAVIDITEHPVYFTVAQTRISFRDHLPAGTEAATITLPQTLRMTNTFTQDVISYTIEIVFSERFYIGIVAADVSANYRVGLSPDTLTPQEGVTVEVIGARIVITGLSNPPDVYMTEGNINITERPQYFTVDQTRISFNPQLPAGVGAATFTLPQPLQVTNAFTGVVTPYTIEINFAETPYIALMASDIIATFTVTHSATSINVMNGEIRIEGTTIIITRFENPRDELATSGDIDVASQAGYFSVSRQTTHFSDPAGMGSAQMTLSEQLIVTNLFDNSLMSYTFRIDFLAYPELMPSNIVATFTVTNSGNQTNVLNGNVRIEGTTIIIAGFTNARDDLDTSGQINITEIDITASKRYFNINLWTTTFLDPPGLGNQSITLEEGQMLVVTDIFDETVTNYTFQINFVAQPHIDLEAAIYMTEIYKESRDRFVVEIYIADTPDRQESVNLRDYGLRSTYIINPGDSASEVQTSLTNFTYPNDWALYEGNFYRLVHLSDPSQFNNSPPANEIHIVDRDIGGGTYLPMLPALDTGCAIFELYENVGMVSGGFVQRQTVDYVRFGDNCPADVSAITYSAGTWDRGSHTVDLSSLNATTSLSRVMSSDGGGFAWRTRGSALNFSGTEWQVSAPTPSLPTDADCVLANVSDDDLDGIYDCLEDEATDTFFGMPLYEWGARTGQVDLFLEIDYMACGVSGSAETQPYEAVLRRLVNKFAEYNNMSLHIDIGGLYDATPDTLDPSVFNLGGGNNYLASASELSNYDDFYINDTFFTTKKRHFSFFRKQVFYYMIVALRGLEGIAGQGELPGNDSMMSLGGRISGGCGGGQFKVERYQYGTMFHELGHNLGLGHGGGDGVNRKPNYKSVMNYGYHFWGSAPTGLDGTNWEADTYYVNARMRRNICAEQQPSYVVPVANYDAQLSDGMAAPLDENNLNETTPLFPSGAGVDFNCNGMFELAVSFDINFDGRRTVLRDYNDVENIGTIFFKDPIYISSLTQSDSHQITPFFKISAPTIAGLITRTSGISNPVGQTIYSDRQPVVAPYEEGLFFRSIFGEAYGPPGGDRGEHSDHSEHGHGIAGADEDSSQRNILKTSVGVVQQLFHELGLIWARVKVFIGIFYK